MHVTDVPARAAAANSADNDATELDRMLVAADEDNYLKPQHETTPTGVRRKCCFCFNFLISISNLLLWRRTLT